MANVTEVGAADIKVQDYKCSIKEITVTSKWKAPNAEVSENVTTTVFDSKSEKKGVQKNIYIITSPDGKDITVKTVREDGNCQRDNHKKYQKQWEDYKATKAKDDRWPLPVLPYEITTTSQKEEKTIVQEEKHTIKCFEIGGASEAFKYLPLPIELDRDCVTAFKYNSCKEGPVFYKVTAYPDISFKAEVTVGTKMAKLKRSSYSAAPEGQKYEKKYKTSFERETASAKYIPERIEGVYDDYTHAKKKIAPPTITLSTTYNNEKDEIEIKVDTDVKEKDNELFYGKYKHDSAEIQIGTAVIQKFGKTVKKAKDTIELLGKICNLQFLKDFIDFDAADLIKNYKPYKIKLEPPSVSITVEGKYQTSKDLTRIGKYIDIGCALDPLLCISLTIDLLFLILSAVSAGTATGIYMIIKNLDKVLEKVLDKDYKKKYEGRLPVDLDIYIDLVLTGSVGGDFHLMINTAEDSYKDMPTDYVSASESIEGELKVDLKAGIKASVNILYFVTANGELSASGSSGIKVKLGLVNRILQGEGMSLQFDTIFLGLKIKYCVKGKVGLFKSFRVGGSIEGETELLEKRKIGFLSGGITFFEDKSAKTLQ